MSGSVEAENRKDEHFGPDLDHMERNKCDVNRIFLISLQFWYTFGKRTRRGLDVIENHVPVQDSI